MPCYVIFDHTLSDAFAAVVLLSKTFLGEAWGGWEGERVGGALHDVSLESNL